VKRYKNRQIFTKSGICGTNRRYDFVANWRIRLCSRAIVRARQSGGIDWGVRRGCGRSIETGSALDSAVKAPYDLGLPLPGPARPL